jgi:hypothetical protein
VLCRSCNEDVSLSAVGRHAVRTRLVGDLVNRLRLVDLVASRPEILAVSAREPVFVVGMPRTGTTFLQRLLSRDRRWRTAPFWEVMDPVPAGEVTAGTPGGKGTDRRVAAGARAVSLARWSSPELVEMHAIVNTEPEEEVTILSTGFSSSYYECMAMLPSYVHWYRSADHTGGYRLFRQFLQAMQWIRPDGDRWLLKAPSHLEMLTPLRAVFPDATLVQTHRDPVTSVASMSSMMAYGTRSTFDHPDPRLIGQFAADYVERLLRASIRDRPADRIVDVRFRQFVADPVGQARRVYEAAGREWDQAAEQSLRAYAAEQAARVSGHRYEPGDFGLNVTALRERFAFYYERFDVETDGWKG